MLSLGNGSSAPGQSVSLPLSLSTSGNQVSGLEWTLAYSTSDFSAISVSIGPTADSAAKNLFCNSTAAGRHHCLVVGHNQSLVTNGVVATAILTVAGNTTNNSSAVSVTTSRSSTPDGYDGPVSGTTGVVTIVLPGNLTALTCSQPMYRHPHRLPVPLVWRRLPQVAEPLWLWVM